MQKVYSRIDWENYPSDKTPINETNLNKMDSALDEVDNRIVEQDTIKATKTEVSDLLKDISFDENTGIITVTKKNGSSITIDTSMEKIAINFDYDAETQQIVLTLIDGTKQYIDLSALITQYEFIDTDTVIFSISTDGKVSAMVKDGSITEDKLQPNYLAQIKVETAKSQTYMNNAEASAVNSQSWAIGGTSTREGEDANNSKYYSDLSNQFKEIAKTYADSATDSVEQISKKLNLAEFNVDNDGYLIYTDNSAYLFSVDNNGNLLWEVE